MTTMKMTRWAALGLLALAGACSSPSPTRYHQLPAVPGPTRTDTAPDARGELVVDTVRIPDALDRPQFVIRQSPTQLRVLDNQRWVSTLSDQLTRALVGDLQGALPQAWVRWREAPGRSGPRHGLRVDVEQLNLGPGTQVELVATWALLDAKERVLRRERLAVQVTAAGTEPEALAPAVSQAVQQFAAGVARHIGAVLQEAPVAP
jgi:uncharacterized lipoprotein YmbA